MQLFSEKGFENTTMEAIAKAADLTEADVYLYFGNREDILLFFYQSINSDWRRFVHTLSPDKLSGRFEAALMKKIELMAPYAAVLANMIGILLSDSKVSVDAPQTSHIRAMGLQTIKETINGATDSKIKKKITSLPSVLFTIHWAILFLYLKTQNKEKAAETIKTMVKALKRAGKFSFALHFFPLINEISVWAEEFINEHVPLNHSVNREIFKVIAHNRKISAAGKDCTGDSCDICFGLHEAKINYFTSQNIPIHFILPAFPAKSPNPQKVLGTLPDLGEEIALTTLESLCTEIESIYPAGASLTICSDGRIFSELVGVTDELVTNYVAGIKALIGKLNLQHIHIVNLEDLMEGSSFDLLRTEVLNTYAEPLADLQDKVRLNPEFRNLFNGIHRFISDDRKVRYPQLSASQVKKDAKLIALKVIQHSNAWTRFLLYVFPNSIRLSIHPYPAHNDKIGIRLTRAIDNWITPWHGVIVLDKDGYMLMKKSEAEEKGAGLVMEDNQPYYYTLIPEQ